MDINYVLQKNYMRNKNSEKYTTIYDHQDSILTHAQTVYTRPPFVISLRPGIEATLNRAQTLDHPTDVKLSTLV